MGLRLGPTATSDGFDGVSIRPTPETEAGRETYGPPTTLPADVARRRLNISWLRAFAAPAEYSQDGTTCGLDRVEAVWRRCGGDVEAVRPLVEPRP